MNIDVVQIEICSVFSSLLRFQIFEKVFITKLNMSTNRNGESSQFSRIPSSGVQLPISTLSEALPRDISGRPLQERLRNQDTTVRWINDSVTGQEKFQVTVNIDGFHQNEVSHRRLTFRMLLFSFYRRYKRELMDEN